MLVRVGPLPTAAIEAATLFHCEALPRVIEAIGKTDGELIVLVFGPADHTHRGWRLAAVQNLAREHAPLRVNGVSGTDEAAIAAAVRYLSAAPGVTGQYFVLDPAGAGNPLA